MTRSFKSALKVSVLSALAIAPVLLSVNGASAQDKGAPGSYVGAGVTYGITNGGVGENTNNINGNIVGRIAVPKTQFSVRGQVTYTDKTSTITPTLTYDLPVANNTNVIVGAGYSLTQKDATTTTAQGNKDHVNLTVGAERQFGQNLVGYGKVDVGIKAFQNSNTPSVAPSVGLGLKF